MLTFHFFFSFSYYFSTRPIHPVLLPETQSKAEKERSLKVEEEKRNRIELEQFQRKFDKKRNKDRRRLDDDSTAPTARPIYFYLLAVAVPLVAIIAAALMWPKD